jgi:hypothetical protein
MKMQSVVCVVMSALLATAFLTSKTVSTVAAQDTLPDLTVTHASADTSGYASGKPVQTTFTISNKGGVDVTQDFEVWLTVGLSETAGKSGDPYINDVRYTKSQTITEDIPAGGLINISFPIPPEEVDQPTNYAARLDVDLDNRVPEIYEGAFTFSQTFFSIPTICGMTIDLDGNGVTDMADLVFFIQKYKQNDAVADVSCDTQVTFLDVITYLQAWKKARQ